MNGAKSCAASFKTEPIMASSGDGPEIKLRATRSGVGMGGRGHDFGAYVGADAPGDGSGKGRDRADELADQSSHASA